MTCMFWEPEAKGGKARLRLEGHRLYVQGVAWDPHHQYIVSQGADRCCRQGQKTPHTKLSLLVPLHRHRIQMNFPVADSKSLLAKSIISQFARAGAGFCYDWYPCMNRFRRRVERLPLRVDVLKLAGCTADGKQFQAWRRSWWVRLLYTNWMVSTAPMSSTKLCQQHWQQVQQLWSLVIILIANDALWSDDAGQQARLQIDMDGLWECQSTAVAQQGVCPTLVTNFASLPNYCNDLNANKRA